MQRGKWFPNARILNLGSRYAGWQRDVEAILGELDVAPLERRFAAGPFSDLPARFVARAGEIRYFCLAGPGVLEITRRLFVANPPTRSLEKVLVEGLADWPDDDCGPDRDESRTNRRPDIEDEFRDLRDTEPDRSAIHIAAHPPHHGRRSEQCTDSLTVTVDCYGIYVSSLKGWLAARCSAGGARGSTLLALLEDPGPDGPAVLLCPELIETAYRASLLDASSSLRQDLDLGCNPSRALLRNVLIHEVGHHVFSNCGDLIDLSEAMANWFAWMLLSPQERTLMHALSNAQSLPYRVYRGLVFLAGLREFVPEQMALTGPPLGDALFWRLPELVSALTFERKPVGLPVATHAPFAARWREDRPQSSHFARFLIAAAQDLQPPGYPDLQAAICSAFDRHGHRMPLEHERKLLATVT